MSRCVPILLLVLVGCPLPDSKGDYDDFLATTEASRQKPVSDAGPVDAKAPTESIKGTYLTVCTSTLLGEAIDKSIRFLTDSDFVAAAGKSTVTLTLRPMPSASRKAAKSETVGDPILFDKVAVDASGKFKGNVANVTMPGSTNPGSGSPLVLEGVSLEGRFGAKEKFCAAFGGKLTSPLTSDFTTTCLFFKVDDGDAFDVTPDTLTIPAKSINAKLVDWVCN